MENKKTYTEREKIDLLIKEYNETESGQEELLGEIFFALKKQLGYKKVLFSSGEMWSNCWNQNNEMSRKLYFSHLTRKITKLELP